MPGLLSWVVTVIRGSKYEASDVVPGPGPNIRHPLSVFPSLHRVPRDRFPGFISTMRVLRLLAAHPAALRFLRLAVPRLHSLFSLPDGRVHRRGLELVTRYLLPGCRRGDDRISQVPGEPQLSVCTCSNPTPAGLLAPDHTVQQRGPWSSKGKGSHDWVFRRSIAWLSDSLSTLRRGRYLPTTQDSLPVAGQALLDGLSTRMVPLKGFRVVSYISSSSPKLCLAQWGQPPRREFRPRRRSGDLAERKLRRLQLIKHMPSRCNWATAA